VDRHRCKLERRALQAGVGGHNAPGPLLHVDDVIAGWNSSKTECAVRPHEVVAVQPRHNAALSAKLNHCTRYRTSIRSDDVTGYAGKARGHQWKGDRTEFLP